MPPKKQAKHHEDNHEKGKDVRRAFEHLSRVGLLRPAIDGAQARPIEVLVATAQHQLAEGHNKQAADLLRAAEHLSFAGLEDEHPGQPTLSEDLIEAIRAQFDHLLAKSAEHWEEDGPLSAIYHAIGKRAAQAYKNGEHHRALELQRAAEALAHVKLDGPHALANRPSQRKLAAS